MRDTFDIGVDVGGTFTDVVCVASSGRIITGKVPTTPGDQAQGILEGIGDVAAEFGLSVSELLRDVSSLVHGTTTATNMMLEWDGARTYMLTTRGFRDVLDFRLNIKEGAFDLRVPPPHAIVPRRRRIPITERIDFAGTVRTPLAEEEVHEAAHTMDADGVESVAICYLFSFTDPSHELRSRDIVREILPQVHISLSHEVLPKIREFERFSTTVVDAYVAPKLSRYLKSLEQRLREEGFGGELFIMKSNGGATKIERGHKRLGVELVMSGPAGGAVAAGCLAAEVRTPNLITMDMGGTSLDVSVVRDYAPHVGNNAWINRHQIGVAVIDLTTIGAGGGSIAWVDDGGALRIGPQSAGALPGPACYGRGGTMPTVTDADLILGFLSSDSFLAGRSALDVDSAARAIYSQVAEPLGMSVSEAAHSIFRVVSASISNALGLVSIQRGYDPRDFALMAFGGAGPVHAGALIADLGIGTVLVPRTYAPVLCALGDTLADIRESNSRAMFTREGDVDPRVLEASFDELVRQSEADMGEKSRSLPGRADRALSMRYVGQSHEVVVPVAGDLNDGTDAAWHRTLESFHRAHEEQFSFSRPDIATEIIGAQVDRWAFRRKPSLTAEAAGFRDRIADVGCGQREVMFSREHGFERVDVFDGKRVEIGFRANGPAIVQEAHTAIVVYPGQFIELQTAGMFVVTA